MHQNRKTARPTGQRRTRLQQKSEEAEARQVARDKRIDQDQLLVLGTRPGESKRERERLLKRMTSGIPKKVRKKNGR